MNNPQTIAERFTEWLDTEGIATFGVDLYLNQVPESAPDICYWVITSGGSPIQRLRTGEKVKQYFATVHHRNISGEELEKNLFNLEQLLNEPNCLQLEGFEVVSVEASQFPSDTDLDNEERRIGMLQANIQVYKSLS